MRIGLDTSVVVRLLTGEPAALAALAARRVAAAVERGAEVVVSDLVVAETYFALQHHYGLTKAQALGSLGEMFRTSPLIPIDATQTVLAVRNLAAARPGFVDRLVHAGYAARSAEMWTFEKSASRLSSVEVLGG